MHSSQALDKPLERRERVVGVNVFRNAHRPFHAAVMVGMYARLPHIPQTGQRAGRQLAAVHGGRGTVQKAGFNILLPPEPLDIRAGPLALPRSLPGPQVVQPASGRGQQHQEDKGGAYYIPQDRK